MVVRGCFMFKPWVTIAFRMVGPPGLIPLPPHINILLDLNALRLFLMTSSFLELPQFSGQSLR